MVDTEKLSKAPTSYTVREVVKVLRCDAATLYRAIREDAFPAVRIRTRYVVPAKVIDQMIAEAIETGSMVDVAKIAAERRVDRELKRLGH
ncbi:putative DNA-binding transcriptional regulator AlpA [Kibdelosporangium banguiense]|uniref:DNA-binding transcriptional regulator AlpA n=1 Tax=Kibdelosporangium banguiense TaxID=1365924 RepID=A0ABS4TZT2_9PSEU|nr:helix-turn-helix domain-containing protein [Kibdelosporangium banguiense]MBP2329498.1 putative DNA-binding transcriptional regulator AlpA [Kibdelosporangium banguiense]